MTFIIQSESTSINAKRALNANLHEGNAGTLERFLLKLTISKYIKRSIVSVATIDNIDVGVCTINRRGLVSVYVNPNYRGQKIAEKLLNDALRTSNRTNQKCYANLGIDEDKSLLFWKRVGVYVENGLTLNTCYSANMSAKEMFELIKQARRSRLREQGFDSKHYMWSRNF